VRAAQRAEALEYHSVWALDRLLYPLAPRTPYPVTPDGSLPEYFKVAMDPVEVLAFAAAHTRRVTLGTSVLNMPYYNPVVTARRLATLDVLSGGRARVGLGQAWSVDELEAVGADPPIYLAAYVPAALRRAAALADGWMPSSLPLAVMAQLVPQLRAFARDAGREPAQLEIIYMAGAEVTAAPRDEASRGVLQGSAGQVRADIERLRELGVTEVVAWGGGVSVEAFLAGLERFREVAG
jgi:alkanesulfonate monooxygenase SsuD/methylene tetrahydromethanopterin reductase-like flavin-dependent oxidoreductase (luciferase family)